MVNYLFTSQPSTSCTAGWSPRLLYVFAGHLLVCASSLNMCTIIMSNISLLPCDFTLSTGVANMSSLAQLRVRDTKKQKQRGHDDARMTESRNTRNEQLTDKELLPGKHLNGSECSKARLIL